MGRKKSRNRKLKIVNKIPAAAISSSSAPPPEAPSSSSPPPPWIELPRDVTANILQRLGPKELLRSAQSVCTTWWKVCQDPSMWRVIYLMNTERLDGGYTIMCRRAVDRSQGQLVDLTLVNFSNRELINYVANRSSNLKRLTLESCYNISGKSLAEAVKKLPQLEELHLIVADDVLANDVETIGISCPTLKSFSFNEHGSKIRIPKDFEDDDSDYEFDPNEYALAIEDDDSDYEFDPNEYALAIEDDDSVDEFDPNKYALAIGKSMPNLRHLQLFGHSMRNEGLEAILDGCPHLESLDIRQCFGLDLEGDLGKRCREQIKDLKFPSDSISDVLGLAGEAPEWDPYEAYDSGSGFSDYDYYGYDEYETYD